MREKVNTPDDRNIAGYNILEGTEGRNSCGRKHQRVAQSRGKKRQMRTAAAGAITDAEVSGDAQRSGAHLRRANLGPHGVW